MPARRIARGGPLANHRRTTLRNPTRPPGLQYAPAWTGLPHKTRRAVPNHHGCARGVQIALRPDFPAP
eukprot:11159487-Lingulodinium_polyedra.AAC.1